jgi:hypothetical protein
LRSGHDFWGTPVSRQHDGAASWNFCDVIYKDHAQVAESLNNSLVMDDLVVAVDRRLEGANHPGQGLNRHLDPCAESTRGGKENLLNNGRFRIGERLCRLLVHGIRGYRH